jgi:hypothetical protein
MELSQGYTRVASVENLRWIPGRQSFHYEPDFCGRMNVVLEEPSPDRVTFSCGIRLAVGDMYTLSDGDDQVFRVKISRAKDNHYTATVVDA